jgi:hypothetical protein
MQETAAKSHALSAVRPSGWLRSARSSEVAEEWKMPLSGIGQRQASGKATKKGKRNSGFRLDEPITIGVCAMEKKARSRAAGQPRLFPPTSSLCARSQTSSKPMQAVLSRLTGFAPGEFKVCARLRRSEGRSRRASRAFAGANNPRAARLPPPARSSSSSATT